MKDTPARRPARAATTPTLPSLTMVASRLLRRFGNPTSPPATDPFGLIVWESAAYLVDDARRLRVFERLRRTIGIDAEAIVSMPTTLLADVIREDGGMLPRLRAEKLQRAASLALDIGPDRLRSIAEDDPKWARKALKRFRGFGEPGIDRILMFNGGVRSVAPDSNASRVLLRLGFGTEDEKNYARQYRSIVEAIAPHLPTKREWLVQTHLLLRRHGQTVCRRVAPECAACPLTIQCIHYARFGGPAAPKGGATRESGRAQAHDS